MQISEEENFKVSEIFRELKSKYESVEKADWFISSLEQTYRELRDKPLSKYENKVLQNPFSKYENKRDTRITFVINDVIDNVMDNVIGNNLLDRVRSSLERIYRKSRGKHHRECTAATLFDTINEHFDFRDPDSYERVDKSVFFLSSMTTYAALKPIVKALIKNDVSYLSELDFACKIYSDTLKEIDFACKFCSDMLEEAEEAAEAKENDSIGFF